MARVLALFLGALVAFTACSSGEAGQIKALIEKSNHQQEDAFAARDPSIMQDSFTAQGFAYMVRQNDMLEQEGAIGIRLKEIEWLDVRVKTATTAEATTVET